MKGFGSARRAACAAMAAQAIMAPTASQNGKKPLWGPSDPHPNPRRIASTSTTPASRKSTPAVARSAARIYFLRSPPLVINSLCSCSAPSTHFTYSAPVANAGRSAPFER